jgi:hypothetical protein
MTALRVLALTAALTMATLGPSCRLFRKSSKTMPPVPPPAAPTQQAPPRQEKPEREVALPPPPQISPAKPDLTQQPPAPAAEKLPPPPKRRGRHKTTEAAAPQLPAPAPPPEAAAATESQVPELEQILTPEQRQAYIDDIDTNIGRAQKTMDALQGRHLSRDQKIYLARVRAFVDQAREARKTDLFRAKNLAERASVLADDLLRSAQ